MRIVFVLWVSDLVCWVSFCWDGWVIWCVNLCVKFVILVDCFGSSGVWMVWFFFDYFVWVLRWNEVDCELLGDGWWIIVVVCDWIWEWDCCWLFWNVRGVVVCFYFSF